MRSGVRLGVDWGRVRIGVAACDPAGTVAYPVATVAAGPRAIEALVALVGEYDPIEVVVGLPRTLAGTEGIAATAIRAQAVALAGALRELPGAAPRPTVRLFDERMSTVAASRRLRESGVRAKKQRAVIDAAAAAGILQAALDAERAGSASWGQLVSAEPCEETP